MAPMNAIPSGPGVIFLRLCVRPCNVGALALCVLLAACSTPRLDIPRGQELQFSVTWSPDVGERIQISNKTLGHDAKVGAKSGGLAGAAVGLSCGPYALFCVPVAGLAGMLVGGVAGWGVGAVESWPGDRVEQLQARLARFQQTHDPAKAWQSALRDRVATIWKVSANPSSISVEIELRELAIHTMRDERGALAALVQLTVVTPEDRLRGNITLTRQFSYVGSFLSSRAWIEAPDEVLDNNFRVAFQYLTDSVLSELGGY